MNKKENKPSGFNQYDERISALKQYHKYLANENKILLEDYFSLTESLRKMIELYEVLNVTVLKAEETNKKLIKKLYQECQELHQLRKEASKKKIR